MIKMLTLRLCIRVWRRAITISNALRPSTWKLLAVGQALLAVFAFWAYHVTQTEAPELGSPSANLADAPAYKQPAPTAPASLPKVSSYQWRMNAYSSGQSFSGTITGTNFIAGDTKIWFCAHSAIVVGTGNCVNFAARNVMLGAGSWQVNIRPSADGDQFRHDPAGIAPRIYNSFASSGGWSFPRLPSVRPIIVSPGPNTGDQSLFATLAPIVLLLQGLVSTLNAMGALVFGWIAYHRGKADAYLKQLQIRKTELELEQLERETAKQRWEAERSGIIIVTG